MIRNDSDHFLVLTRYIFWGVMMTATKKTLLMYGGLAVASALVIGFLIFGVYRMYLKKVASNQIEQTLAIIKPDAVKTHNIGKIIDKIEQDGFTIVDLRKVQLDRELAERFYQEHKGKAFFHQLVDFMASGPIVVLVLEKMNAIQSWRNLMGNTDPAKAPDNSLRKQFGTTITQNAVHGSDGKDTAMREIGFFFADRAKK